MHTRSRWVSSNPCVMTTRRADRVNFKGMLGTFATGVTVVTAVDERGGSIGMTVSAVSAVSLNPPLLLVCVSKTARFHAAWDYRKGFALNVLAHNQESLSEHFAKGVDNPFDGVAHTLHDTGLVLLDEVVAQIICGRWNDYDAGDHTVIFGEVIDGQVFERRPLIHSRSRYTTTAD